ncbi:unnamed protein product [Ranitomeya imitator]|uniref:Tryptophan synthase beta chain-like PALP domain-containing protein n=1 Tax=Ranitomeya imitator TaxID=111125 RepID=A0ABN9MF49_9NEOB|nr:unnamed protein product [Ranitomeya imitator]
MLLNARSDAETRRTCGRRFQTPEPDAQALPVLPRRDGTWAIKPNVKIYAAEPLNADDCYRSKTSGILTANIQPPITVADGVKTSIGPSTWPIIRDLVDEVFVVTEDEIKNATRLVWERMKLLIEPTAGLGLAAVLSSRFQEKTGDAQNIGVVLCGGNVDLSSIDWIRESSPNSS